MEECSIVRKLMVIGCKLRKANETTKLDQNLFRPIIGNLLYLKTSIPYFMQAVCIIKIFQATPKQSHLLAAKRILKYLRAMMDYALWYPRDKYFSLMICTDVD